MNLILSIISARGILKCSENGNGLISHASKYQLRDKNGKVFYFITICKIDFLTLINITRKDSYESSAKTHDSLLISSHFIIRLFNKMIWRIFYEQYAVRE